MRRNAGFTVVKITLAMAIIALPAVIAAPSFLLAAKGGDGREPRVLSLLESLSDPSAALPSESAKNLADLCRAYPGSVSFLISILSACNVSLADQDRFRLVSGILAELGPASSEAIPALLDKLRDGAQRRIRHDAAIVLGRVGQGSSAAAEGLLQALRDTDDADLRMLAAASLGELRDTRSMSALVEALQDKDADVRTFSARALGNFNLASLENLSGAKVVAAVSLRPDAAKLSPEDAKQIRCALDYEAFLLIGGKKFRTAPPGYVCDKETLVYDVLAPDGAEYRLNRRANPQVSGPPVRFGLGISEILDRDGIRFSPKGVCWFEWGQGRVPRFDMIGTYRIKLRGNFHSNTEASLPLEFESNEMTYEVSRRFASNASLVRRTREHLERELGVDTHSLTGRVSEDTDSCKVVAIRVRKELYPEERLPGPRQGGMQYYGLNCQCRFAPEGEFLSAKIDPAYGIVCP